MLRRKSTLNVSQNRLPPRFHQRVFAKRMRLVNLTGRLGVDAVVFVQISDQQAFVIAGLVKSVFRIAKIHIKLKTNPQFLLGLFEGAGVIGVPIKTAPERFGSAGARKYAIQANCRIDEGRIGRFLETIPAETAKSDGRSDIIVGIDIVVQAHCGARTVKLAVAIAALLQYALLAIVQFFHAQEIVVGRAFGVPPAGAGKIHAEAAVDFALQEI